MGYRVYASNTLESSACSWYRIIQPLHIMSKMGCPIEVILDDGRAYISEQQRTAMFLESDISLIYQNVSESVPFKMNHSKTFKALRSAETGDTRWPPSFVVDTDDDLFNVMPLNIAYGQLGTRRHDGIPLVDGEEVGIAHPTAVASAETEAVLFAENPAPIPGMKAKVGNTRFIYNPDGHWYRWLSLWRDGGDNKNFDIASNRRRIQNWTDTLRAANLVTCSTPRAAEYIHRELGPDINTYVSYNSINFDDFQALEMREHPGEVRILWEGSSSHHEGLWPLNESIRRVAKRYPHASWYFWGAPYKWAIENLPNAQMVPWVPYDAYKLRLSTICHDISIAPLSPAVFNQSRSAIRWYESSVIWRPAATLAQNTGPYRDEMLDGQTGLLFDTPEEFETKLGGLIEDATLRQTLASNAKDWVRTHREAKDITRKLFQKWVEARENHKATMPEDVELAVT